MKSKIKRLKLSDNRFFYLRFITGWLSIFYCSSVVLPSQSYAELTKASEHIIEAAPSSQEASQNQTHIDQQNAVQEIQSQSTRYSIASESENFKKSLLFVAGLMQRKLGKDFTVSVELTQNLNRPYVLTVTRVSEASDGESESIVIGSNSNFEASVESVKFKGVVLTKTDIDLLKEAAEQKEISFLDFLLTVRVSFLDGDHTVHFNFNGKDQMVYRFEGSTYVSEDISVNWRQPLREAKGRLADGYTVVGFRVGKNDAILLKQKLNASISDGKLSGMMIWIDSATNQINLITPSYKNTGTINPQILLNAMIHLSLTQDRNENLLVLLTKIQIQASTQQSLQLKYGNNEFYYFYDETGKIRVKNGIDPLLQPAVDALKSKFGETAQIDVYADSAAPGLYFFSISIPAPQTGQVHSLKFYADSKGNMDVSKPVSIDFAMPNGINTSVDSKMLFSGLKQIIDLDSMDAIASMILNSSDSSQISFNLGGNSWKISKDANNAVTIIPTSYDVALKLNEGYKIYGPVSTDLERGDLLRTAIQQMKAGDTLMLGEGRFDCDAKTRGVLVFPDHVNVIGSGADKTHLFSNSWSDMQGAAYQVRNGNFSDLTFENQTWKLFEDGRTIEMYDGYKRTPDNLYYVYDANGRRVVEEANPGPFTATFDRVKFVGDAWVVYDWSGRGNTWIIRDSTIVGGRQGVSMMSSGGRGQNAYILRTTFDIDVMRSMDIGHTSDSVYGGAYGVVARGGNIKVEDSEFHIKGGRTPHRSSYAPRAVGVYDGNDFDTQSSSWTSIELINNRWFIEGNGSRDVYDIFMTNEAVKNRLQVIGGYGSGLEGLITKNW